MIEGAGRELFFVRAFGFFWRERFFDVSLRRSIRIEGCFPADPIYRHVIHFKHFS